MTKVFVSKQKYMEVNWLTTEEFPKSKLWEMAKMMISSTNASWIEKVVNTEQDDIEILVDENQGVLYFDSYIAMLKNICGNNTVSYERIS